MTHRSLPLSTDRTRRTLERVRTGHVRTGRARRGPGGRDPGGHDLLGTSPLGRPADAEVEDVTGTIDRRLGHRTLLAWWLLLVTSQAVMPPAEGAAAERLSALEVVLELGFLAVMTTVTLLLARGRRSGAHAALWGGIAFLAAAIACPATGHHALAAWWYWQLALTSGMVVVGGMALRASRR